MGEETGGVTVDGDEAGADAGEEAGGDEVGEAEGVGVLAGEEAGGDLVGEVVGAADGAWARAEPATKANAMKITNA